MAIDQKAVSYCIIETNLSPSQVQNTLDLLITESCTVPFITRYRKEKTGGLDEVQIMAINDAFVRYNEIEKRREFILKAIEKLEKLTPKLKEEIISTKTLNQLEDIYAPFKSKRKTKGMTATEAGLAPLAQILKTSNDSIDSLKEIHGKEFLNPEKKINSFEDAIKGACDIIIEELAHNQIIKEELRTLYWREAKIRSTLKKDGEKIKNSEKFKDYFDYTELIQSLNSPKSLHRFMAIRRGMSEKILKVEVIFDEDIAYNICINAFDNISSTTEILKECAQKAYKTYIHPSLDLELKSELKKLADLSAIEVFTVNLRNLLLAPYLGQKAVLGVDPGIRTGCKLAVISTTGKFEFDAVIYPHPPKEMKVQSGQMAEALIYKFNIENIAIGNGTYGRETLQFFQKYVAPVKDGKVKATMISESGASIYSTSEIARNEFPDKDPTVRGAISIARRFQDPLAELVKIDPKSIGVGQYQHDVNGALLKKGLSHTVESCVNYVGVDLNTASAPLLSYVSGIGKTLAGSIVDYREKMGGIFSRSELKKVARFSEKIFEQSAGFLRIYNGKNPLDGTFIHPEQYKTIKEFTKSKNITLHDLITNPENINLLSNDSNLLSKIGEFTFNDIVKSLQSPSQDPRTEFTSTDFRSDITEIKDLKINEWYPGVVTNITQFGAFVDIGIKENGLLHISQIADKFVEDPLKELKVGEAVKVKVIDIDFSRKRIALSRKSGEEKSLPDKQYSKDQGARNRQMPKRKEEKLKNNAFSALKNFKVK